MKAVELLKTNLMPLLPINQARIIFIAQFVIALIDAQTSVYVKEVVAFLSSRLSKLLLFFDWIEVYSSRRFEVS